jgi:hypothetical protein
VNLIVLSCKENQLTSLDVTNNKELSRLGCDQTVIVTGCGKYVEIGDIASDEK